MIYKILMPGEGNVDSGIIIKWYVREGDTVDVGDILCEIETSKTVYGLESPVCGTVNSILRGKDEDDEIPAMEEIAFIKIEA